MFVNLIVLLIIIAITVFLGRLTYRAVKAQRMWVKILGGLGAGLLTLVFAAVSFLGTLTQAEFIQSFRTGIRPDGTPFSDAMPWKSASMMTDDDLAALYIYLTTAP